MNRLFQTFILPLLVPVLIGIGTSSVLALRLEERIVSIERRITQHDGEFSRLREAKDTVSERVTRLESTLPAMQRDMAEIKSDIKSLLGRIHP